jgi:fumarylacetoacetase
MTRAWLEDNDEVTISATALGPDGARISFGAASGQVIPAIEEAVG